jgi:hypothetical protein
MVEGAEASGKSVSPPSCEYGPFTDLGAVCRIIAGNHDVSHSYSQKALYSSCIFQLCLDQQWKAGGRLAKYFEVSSKVLALSLSLFNFLMCNEGLQRCS